MTLPQHANQTRWTIVVAFAGDLKTLGERKINFKMLPISLIGIYSIDNINDLKPWVLYEIC